MAIVYQLDDIVERIAPAPHQRFARVVFDHNNLKNTPVSISYFRFTSGQHGPKHSHANEVEIYIVCKGRGEVIVGDDIIEMKPGTLVYVQPTIEHQTFNTGEGDLEFYGIFSPSVDFTEMLSWEPVSY